MKRCTLVLLVGLVLASCGPALFGGVNIRRDHGWLMQNNAAYGRASPEIQQKILQGKIRETMTIDECKAAWNKTRFELLVSRSSGYELWRAGKGESEKTFYLHVRDGVVTEISVHYNR